MEKLRPKLTADRKRQILVWGAFAIPCVGIAWYFARTWGWL